MALNYEVLEEWLLKSLYLKRGVIWSRSVWLFLFFIFLKPFESQTGDVLILAFFQALLFAVLAVPEGVISPRASRFTLVTADFLLMLWGLWILPGRNVPLTLFLVTFYLACLLISNLKSLILLTIFYLLILPALIYTTTSPNVSIHFYAAALQGGLILALAVYLGITNLPGSPSFFLLEQLKNTARWQRSALEAQRTILLSQTLGNVLENCHHVLLRAFPATQVEIAQVTGEQILLFTGNSFHPDRRAPHEGRFTIPMKMETGGLSLSPPPGTDHAKHKERLLEIAFPLYQREGADRSFYVRLINPMIFLSDLERDFIQAIKESSSFAIDRLLQQEKGSGEQKENIAKIQNLQKEYTDLAVSANLLSRLNMSYNTHQCLEACQELFFKAIEADTLMLFLSRDGGSCLELADQHSRHAVLMEQGFRLPSMYTLMGNSVSQDKVMFYSVFNPADKEHTLYQDAPHFLRSEIRSLLILPLREPKGSLPFGCLVIGSKKSGQFKMENINALGDFQAPISAAFYKNLKIAESDLHTGEAEQVYSMIKLLLSSESNDYFFNEFNSSLQHTFHLDDCRILLHDPTVGGFYTWITNPDRLEAQQIVVQPDPSIEKVRQEKKVITVNFTLEPKTEYSELYFTSQTASRLIVPITCQDEFFGLIDASRHQENAFGDEDIRALSTVCSMLAMTLRHARLLVHRDKSAGLDPLTGLPERQLFIQKFEAEAGRLIKAGKPFSLLLLDINGLGQINTTHGLSVGDSVLRAAGAIIKRACHEHDFCGRVGGDEFALLLPNIELEAAMEIYREMAAKIRDTQIVQLLSPQLSGGVSVFPQHGQTPTALYQAAQEALAEAQERGTQRLNLPSRQIISLAGKQLEIHWPSLYQEVLGPNNQTGPQALDTINRIIVRFQEGGLDAEAIGDILYRLVLKLDYPDKHMEYFNLVPGLVARLGKEMNLPPSKIREMILAAKIYDIGKFSISQDILYATRSLNQEERELVKYHVGVGIRQVLQNHRIFANVLTAIKFHHERWDGSGYPWQLKADEIPIESRILGIVDVFKAMVTERPYRRRNTPHEALQAIIQLKGTQFDAALIDALLKTFELKPSSTKGQTPRETAKNADLPIGEMIE